MAKIGSLTADLRLESAAFIRDLRKAAQETAANTNRMTRQMRGLQRSTAAVSRSFGDLRRLLAAYVGINAVRNFVQTADAAARLEGQLRLVTGSTQELRDTQQSLFELAQKTRGSLEGTVELYARLARSTQELKTSQDDLLEVTEAINNAIVISGASSSSADAAIIQLGQGFAAGALRGEELNSVLEQTPRLAQAIAEGLGVSIGQLRELGKEGRLTSEAVFSALLNQSEKLRAEFAIMPRTVSQALTQLNNEWIRTVSGANDASGATLELAETIDRVRGVIASQQFISALTLVAKGFAAIAENMGLVVAAGGAIVGGRLGSALLGRLGAIAGAVAGGTEAWLAYKRSLDAAKKSIEELENAASGGGGGGGPSTPPGLPPAVDDKLIDRQKEFEAGLIRTIDQTRNLTAETTRGTAALEALKDRYDATNDVLRLEIDATSEYGRRLIELGVAARQADRELAAAEMQMADVTKLADQMGSTVASSFADAVVEGEKFSDVINSLVADLSKLVLNQAFQSLIGGATGPAGGTGFLGSIFHAGGVVGRGGHSSRQVPAATFLAAPRLHNGLRADEFPAILQAGETVIPKGGSGANITIINSGTPKQGEAKPDPGGQPGRDWILQLDDIQAKNLRRGGSASNMAVRGLGGRAPLVER